MRNDETPRTMILLDPDLEPDPVLRSDAGKPKAGANTPNLRMPSTRSLAQFLNQAKDAVGLHGQITVLLTTDAAQRSLNRRFRGKNKPTDVLSFPTDSNAHGLERIAGDLSISVPTARRQASQQDHSLGTEVKVLILHGLLHLAGYDHETDAGQMARRERSLRARLRLPVGLIERASSGDPRSRSKKIKQAKRQRA